MRISVTLEAKSLNEDKNSENFQQNKLSIEKKIYWLSHWVEHENFNFQSNEQAGKQTFKKFQYCRLTNKEDRKRNSFQSRTPEAKIISKLKTFLNTISS